MADYDPRFGKFARTLVRSLAEQTKHGAFARKKNIDVLARHIQCAVDAAFGRRAACECSERALKARAAYCSGESLMDYAPSIGELAKDFLEHTEHGNLATKENVDALALGIQCSIEFLLKAALGFSSSPDSETYAADSPFFNKLPGLDLAL